MARRSFWEKLGRGVGHGLHKAMELGSNVADHVEGKLELEKAEEALAREHEALGRAVADAHLTGGGTTPPPASPAIQDLLEKIRTARELVEKLREEREAQERAEKERAEREQEERQKEGAGREDQAPGSEGGQA